MPLYYHYTEGVGAQQIISDGKIKASLNYMTGGDTAFGNGVYLTELDPSTYNQEEIAMNNWLDDSPEIIRKTENYFVLDIPLAEVEDNSVDGRNIFLYGWQNDLRLYKYPWWLMNYDSREIIASYRYQLATIGPASRVVNDVMGDYDMIDETINGRPVYQSCRGSEYLFMTSIGYWIVRKGDFRGNGATLVQSSNYSLGPDADVRWNYSNKGRWMDDDVTLKCLGWQI